MHTATNIAVLSAATSCDWDATGNSFSFFSEPDSLTCCTGLRTNKVARSGMSVVS